MNNPMIPKPSMQLSMAWKYEEMTRRVFSWLTRIGAAPKFGSRPISWYQMHQSACIEILFVDFDADIVRCSKGIVQRWKDNRWKNVISATELFDKADIKCRGLN